MTESMNHTEVTCVADFLNILKNDVEELDSGKERFFRGLSKTDYIDTDYPSIYRSPDNNPKYEPYIKYEHEMFYDLVSRFPEQFSSCKNTFEHLVMMQHYGFPTRLLDVTSNPLVALYFACVDRHGKVNSGEDGAVTIYDISDKKIKNYNSDTVTILSNLARISNDYAPFHSLYNVVIRKMSNIFIMGNATYPIEYYKKIAKEFIYVMDLISKRNVEKVPYSGEIDNLLEDFEKLQNTSNDVEPKNYDSTNNKIKKNYQNIFTWLVSVNKINPFTPNIKFKHLIQEEKNYFIYENINPLDLISFFCVKPKLNNPRLINQNGAFLLSGFANNESEKLQPPTTHFESKAKNKKTQKSINIIISNKNKQVIYDELNRLGIHRAFLFPEIDKVAQIVTNKYKIKRDDSPQTN